MKSRQKFETRKILLREQAQVDLAIAALRNAPLDASHPVEFLLREEVKGRKPDQNALMWSGPLVDIAVQCWAEGRQYSDVVWHEYFKAQFLPEDFYPELCKEGYRKWDFDPGGNRVLIGSTTGLTIKGFSQYLEQIHAFGAQMGVEFHEPPARG